MIPYNFVETSESIEINRTGKVIKSEKSMGKIKVENRKLLDLNRVEYSHLAIRKKFLIQHPFGYSYYLSESTL